MRRPEKPGWPDSMRMAEDRASAPSRPLSETRPRKLYRRPRLVSYGRLADVTRFQGSVPTDSGGGLGPET